MSKINIFETEFDEAAVRRLIQTIYPNTVFTNTVVGYEWLDCDLCFTTNGMPYGVKFRSFDHFCDPISLWNSEVQRIELLKHSPSTRPIYVELPYFIKPSLTDIAWLFVLDYDAIKIMTSVFKNSKQKSGFPDFRHSMAYFVMEGIEEMRSFAIPMGRYNQLISSWSELQCDVCIRSMDQAGYIRPTCSKPQPFDGFAFDEDGVPTFVAPNILNYSTHLSCEEVRARLVLDKM